MRPPVGFTGEFEDFCASQRIDDAVRQIGRAHIGHRRRVDRIARRPAQKIAQEHEARFARSGAERREPVRAELRRVTGLAGVARPGVVDADAGRGAKAGAERRFLLGAEQVQLGGHEPHHLALRDRQARSGQHGHDPLTGHLTLKMQRQNQTMQMRAAAAHNARRQFSRYRPPVRHRPPLAPVERHLGFERNILNDDVFVALVTRTRRRRRRQRHRAVDAQLRHAGTATARRRRIRLARLLRRKTIGRLFHARRLHWRSRRQALQTPDLVLKLLVLEPRRRQRRVLLLVFFPKPLNLADQSANQPDQLGRAKTLKRIIRAR